MPVPNGGVGDDIMKLQIVKKLGVASVALLGLCLVLSSVFADSPTTAVVSQQTVVSLPYHGAVSAPPHSVSLFFEEADIYVGEMLCSDKARNIYIYDQISSEKCAIKKFDARGKPIENWSVDLHGLGDGVSATVLPDGKVWFNLGVGASASGEKSGLPFVVLQPGRSKPVMNWQQSTPESVTKILYDSVTSETWQKMLPRMQSDTRTWMITRLDSVEDKVLLDVTNFGGGETYYPPEAKITNSQKLSWQLLLSGDGKQLIKAKAITEREARTRTLLRSSDGALWHSEWDSLNTRPQNWTKLWVWKEGQPKGEPLVRRSDLAQPLEPWHKLIGTQPKSPPFIFVDDEDNIFLMWRRKAKGPAQQFTVGTESWSRDPINDDYGERALVVLDAQRKFVASVPWTICYYQSQNWIFPVPDGIGFYRSEFGSKAMDIYWHPLPNFKAPIEASAKAPTKPQPMKR